MLKPWTFTILFSQVIHENSSTIKRLFPKELPLPAKLYIQSPSRILRLLLIVLLRVVFRVTYNQLAFLMNS